MKVRAYQKCMVRLNLSIASVSILSRIVKNAWLLLEYNTV